MAWDNNDWQYVGVAPNGTGLYQNKYNPEMYADGNGRVGEAKDFGLSSGSFSAPRQLPDGFWVVEKDGKFYDYNNTSVQVDPSLHAKAPSGGGNTTINYNTQAANDLGPNRYVFVTSDGSDGLPPGSTYQKDLLDGSMSNIKLATGASSNPDPDGDGYDNKTGLPVGVTSFGGKLYYKGVEVNPDGSPKTAGKPDAPTWTGYGPKGQGTYYLDGPGGTPGTYIGATQAPSTSSGGSSSSTIRISAPSSGGGGRSGSSSQYDTAGYRQMTQAVLEREAALAALKGPDTVSAEGSANRQFQAEQNAMDRAQRQQEQAAALRQTALGQFGSAVSDTDPAQLAAWLYANGFENGGSIQNRIAEGGNAISANALVRAAGLLDTIRGGNAGGAMLGVPQGPSIPGLGPGSVDPQGTTPGATPTPTPGATPGMPATPPTPTLLGNWRLMKDINGQPQVWQNADTGAVMPYIPGEGNAPTDFAGIPGGQGAFRAGDWIRMEVGGQPIGWVNALDRTRREYDPNDPNGRYLTTLSNIEGLQKTPGQNLLGQLYTDANGVQRVMNSGDGAYELVDGKYQLFSGAEDDQLPVYIQNGQMADRVTSTGLPNPWTPGTFDATGTWRPSGMAPPVKPKGNLEDDNIQRALPETTRQATLPGLARGGVAYGTMLVGEEGPEIVHAPGGASVTPISRPMMRGLQRGGMPGYATGTLDTLDGPTYAQPAPTTTQGTTSTPTTQGTTQPTTQAAPQPVPPLDTPSGSYDVSNQTPEQTAVQGAIANTGTTPAIPGLNTNDPLQNLINGGVNATAAQLQEIYDWRTKQPIYDVNPLSLTYQSLDPVTQRAILQQYQTRYGIPVEAMAWNIQRNQIPGLSRGSAYVGY